MRKRQLLERIEALEREVAELRGRVERPSVWVNPYLPAYDIPDVVIPSVWGDNGTWAPKGTITTNIKYNDQVLWATPDGCHWYAEEKAGFSTCG